MSEKVKEINDKKIAFILCVNDMRAYEEAEFYINKLKIPEGMSTEIVKIEGAASMCSGYNKAMLKCDAKYKVYMHQDVYIVNDSFLYDILKIFQDDEVGMIGMVGSPEFPKEGVMWYRERCGTLYDWSANKSGMISMEVDIEGEYMSVQAIDGFMMITSIDMPWREDIFDGWDFYDISKSRDIINIGKKVVVPKQEQPWCIHDDGYLNLVNYFKYRELFINEYNSI